MGVKAYRICIRRGAVPFQAMSSELGTGAAMDFLELQEITAILHRHFTPLSPSGLALRTAQERTSDSKTSATCK